MFQEANEIIEIRADEVTQHPPHMADSEHAEEEEEERRRVTQRIHFVFFLANFKGVILTMINPPKVLMIF